MNAPQSTIRKNHVVKSKGGFQQIGVSPDANTNIINNFNMNQIQVMNVIRQEKQKSAENQMNSAQKNNNQQQFSQQISLNRVSYNQQQKNQKSTSHSQVMNGVEISGQSANQQTYNQSDVNQNQLNFSEMHDKRAGSINLPWQQLPQSKQRNFNLNPISGSDFMARQIQTHGAAALSGGVGINGTNITPSSTSQGKMNSKKQNVIQNSQNSINGKSQGQTMKAMWNPGMTVQESGQQQLNSQVNKVERQSHQNQLQKFPVQSQNLNQQNENENEIRQSLNALKNNKNRRLIFTSNRNNQSGERISACSYKSAKSNKSSNRSFVGATVVSENNNGTPLLKPRASKSGGAQKHNVSYVENNAIQNIAAQNQFIQNGNKQIQLNQFTQRKGSIVNNSSQLQNIGTGTLVAGQQIRNGNKQENKQRAAASGSRQVQQQEGILDVNAEARGLSSPRINNHRVTVIQGLGQAITGPNNTYIQQMRLNTGIKQQIQSVGKQIETQKIQKGKKLDDMQDLKKSDHDDILMNKASTRVNKGENYSISDIRSGDPDYRNKPVFSDRSINGEALNNQNKSKMKNTQEKTKSSSRPTINELNEENKQISIQNERLPSNKSRRLQDQNLRNNFNKNEVQNTQFQKNDLLQKSIHGQNFQNSYYQTQQLQEKGTKKIQSSSINHSNKVTASFQPINPGSRNLKREEDNHSNRFKNDALKNIYQQSVGQKGINKIQDIHESNLQTNAGSILVDRAQTFSGNLMQGTRASIVSGSRAVLGSIASIQSNSNNPVVNIRKNLTKVNQQSRMGVENQALKDSVSPQINTAQKIQNFKQKSRNTENEIKETQKNGFSSTLNQTDNVFFNSNKEHFIEDGIQKNFEFQQKLLLAKTPTVNNNSQELENIKSNQIEKPLFKGVTPNKVLSRKSSSPMPSLAQTVQAQNSNNLSSLDKKDSLIVNQKSERESVFKKQKNQENKAQQEEKQSNTEVLQKVQNHQSLINKDGLYSTIIQEVERECQQQLINFKSELNPIQSIIEAQLKGFIQGGNFLGGMGSGQQDYQHPLKDFEDAKFASKSHGLITSYSANTHQGIQRNYNEDRVSIILNMTKPEGKDSKTWPKCSFFAIYDGHGGSNCADFLKDHLHTIIINQPCFPKDPYKALQEGCQIAESRFLKNADQGGARFDKSGSCAIIVLTVETECYIANVGDSRAVMSAENGMRVYDLSQDHRPNEEAEFYRIQDNGGQVYQTQTFQTIPVTNQFGQVTGTQKQMLYGPYRVLPGRLSVSRTFGDIEAKMEKYGGKEGVVIAKPEISQFTINEQQHDFIVLGCDGIFEKLNSINVIDSAWSAMTEVLKNNNVQDHEQNPTSGRANSTNQKLSNSHTQTINKNKSLSIHQISGKMADAILRSSAIERSFDNLTIVIIVFKNLQNFYEQAKLKNYSDKNYKAIKIEGENQTPLANPIRQPSPSGPGHSQQTTNQSSEERDTSPQWQSKSNNKGDQPTSNSKNKKDKNYTKNQKNYQVNPQSVD